MRSYAVIGIGYVGLELAVAFAKHTKVYACDINAERINELKAHKDRNLQVKPQTLKDSAIKFTTKINELKDADFFIVTVPTPAFFYETPQLVPIISATKDLASILKKNDIVVFESTVYPGATEEVFIPLLEKHSNLTCGEDFNVGYSPEEINMNDSEHTLKSMTKIIASQNTETLSIIQKSYELICKNTHIVANIPTSEAVKLLENIQRDVNIALMNEFSKIMHTLNLNLHDVIEGASKKWNFVPYRPGLVGGHCISIDPHYLAFKAKRHSQWPDLILTARKVNDNMPKFIIESLFRLIVQNKLNVKNIKVGVFGIAYKENSTDIRNSLALKLVKELREAGLTCLVHDPFPHSKKEVLFDLDKLCDMQDLSIVILAVGHAEYQKLGLQGLKKFCNSKFILMDIPNLFVSDKKAQSNFIYWNL